MRRILLITVAVQCVIALRAQAVKLPFEQEYVEPFYAPKLQVVWAATNQLPTTVRIFKVIPANFSTTALSNLTAMGGSAVVKHGWMNLYKPTDARLPLEKVPDKMRAYELGTNILAKLEISVSELETEGDRLKVWYSPGFHGHMDKATRKMITEPCTMGIEFHRVLDGVECFGQRVRIQYESREAVTQLEVRWCGMQPDKICSVASQDQIISWIKEGRARAHPMETTGSRWIKVADIKKVVIRNIQILYDAGPDWENSEKSPDYLYPYAGISAEVEFSPDDRETIELFCPVIKEALCRPIRQTSEFNILPRNFNEKQRQEVAE